MTPGPSPLAPEVKLALAKDILHHRTEAFRNILKDVHEGLKYVFQTNNPVLILASSGTGAMEASVVNFLSKKDKVLVVSGGKFGERWQEICKRYDLEVIVIEVEWGKAPSIDEIKNILDKNKDIKAVFTTLCETSTATVYDVEKIAKVVSQTSAILVVDAISGLGADKIKTDDWAVDVVVSGSQKSLMLPPGLSFVSISKKAEQLMESSNLPKYYLDLKKALKAYAKDDTPYTPSVSLIVALKEVLEIIKKEGIENIWEKFDKISKALREALKSLGFEIYSSSPSSAVTAVVVGDISAKKIVSGIRNEFGISIAAGQDKIADKIIRIAHMGYINAQDVVMTLSALEKTLKDLGVKINLGDSVKRFQEVYYV